MAKIDPWSAAMMALVGALWGLHGPAIKLAFGAGFTFPQLVFWEYVVGTVVFGAVLFGQRGRLPRDGRFWRGLLLAAGVGCGVPLFLFWSYRLGPVSVAATLLFLYVPFTQLLNGVLTRRAPPGREIVAGVLVVVGAGLASELTAATQTRDLAGAPLAMLAAFCFSVFLVVTARLGTVGGATLRSGVCCAVSCVVMAVVAGAAGWNLWPDGLAVTAPEAVGWVIGLGVMGQVIPVFLLVRHGPRVGSGAGAILTATELPVAVVVAAWVLGDRAGTAQVLGVLLVLGGIALPQLGAGRRTAGDGAGT